MPVLILVKLRRETRSKAACALSARLGSGGTALVFHVRREGRDYALKVPHDAGCGERLLAEAKTLREICVTSTSSRCAKF